MNHLSSNWLRNLILAVIAAVVGVFCAFSLGKIDDIYTRGLQADVRQEKFEQTMIQQHGEMVLEMHDGDSRLDAEIHQRPTYPEVDLSIEKAIEGVRRKDGALLVKPGKPFALAPSSEPTKE